MAKKVVATLKKGDAVKLTKAVRMVKSPKTGSYVFVEKMLEASKVEDFFNAKTNN